MKSTPTNALRAALLAGLLLSGQAAATTYSKTEVITYQDNTIVWVLGQTASVTCTAAIPVSTACDGDVVASTTFDPTYALPVTFLSFGKLQGTYGYDTAAITTVDTGQRGTFRTVTDGNNHTTTYMSWVRGIPTLVRYADSTTDTAVVNAATGWISSTTDENGFTTNYTYDAMGRIASVAYPTGDAVAWATTTRSFVSVASVEYGIPAGHWRQTTSTGSGVQVTYYDALWRPLLMREYDAGNVAGTEHFIKTTYNGQGQVEFASYPSNSSTPTTGRWSYYDALGRMTSSSQDSELGLLTTTTTFGSPFTTTVTNARGNATTSSYLTYDQPSTDTPTQLLLPANVTTDIARDPHGKPLTITRSGSYLGGPLSLTRRYVYDDSQRLCQTINPESGTTIVDYDPADNVLWSAEGQVASGTTAATCATDRATTSAGAKTMRTLDARNRVTFLATPGDVADITTTYSPDGRVTSLLTKQAGSDIVTNTYTYNRRRLLTHEAVQVNSLLPWPFDYAYNANGHLSSQTYPGALVVGYAPDALGRPTQVGTFASGVTYYPTGAISGFTYGNGIVHTMTPNARQLPSHSVDAYGATKFLDDTYTFDASGNVMSMADAAGTGLNDRSWGVLSAYPTQYDGLDRLWSVRGTNWGTPTPDGYNARYTYDALDNIRYSQIGASNYSYNYDLGTSTNTNRLLSMQRNGGTTYAIASDPAGSITSDARNGHGYQFDIAHRLTAVTGPGAESYLYDGNGRRARTLNSTTGTIEYFGYGADGRLLQDWSSRRGNRKGYIYLGNTLVATYGVTTVNPNNGAITIEYKHTDALGSPVVTTDATRGISGRQLYTPYGVPLAPVDGVGYTGHVNDVGTGLTYMQQRYYDPAVGRFLSVDPVTSLDGGQQHFNRYDYAYNSPYKFTDPDGRCPMCAGFAIGAGIDIAVQVASNMAQGQDFGDAVSNINGTQVLISGALGAVGQLGGSTAARTVVSGLSNGAKGRLGEGVARAGIALRGEKVIVSQTAAGKVAELGQLAGRAAKAVPDFVVRARDGAVKVVEAKFNTAGLTGAQRALRSELGSAFTVSRTTVGEVANAGGVAGAVAGGSAGATAGEIKKGNEDL